MKPRYDEAPLLTKAAEIQERIDRLVKAKDDSMKTDCKMDGADMATKDKYCMKNFGKKYSECSAK